MTIDELFSLPICEMKTWLEENYHDPKGKLIDHFWYTDFTEVFGIEFPEDSNWRIVPVWSNYDFDRNNSYYRHYNNILEYTKGEGGNLIFGVVKKSKYGELLSIFVEGVFPRKLNTKFEIKEINYNIFGGHDNQLSRIYIEGKDIVNNSDIYIHRKQVYNEEEKKWFKTLNFIDDHICVIYDKNPIFGAVKKNKHIINDYVNDLENYAKNALELGNKFLQEKYNKFINTNEVKIISNKYKKYGLTPEILMELWLNLYIKNQDVTLDDLNGMFILSNSKENKIIEYRDKYNCYNFLDSTWYKDQFYTSWYSYSSWHSTSLVGFKPLIDSYKFIGYVNNLDKTRELYSSLGSYKNQIKDSKKEYHEEFEKIALDFENDINECYKKVYKDLSDAKKKYLDRVKKLYKDIHNKYQGINDTDINVHENIIDITDNIIKSFKSTALKVMRQEHSNYKVNKKKEPKEYYSKEFLRHCKKMFNVATDLDKIIYFEVHKCYDAPYEIYISDDVPFIDEDSIYEYEEKYGQGSYDKWLNKFCELMPSQDTNISHYNDLYPGCRFYEYIDRNLEQGEEDNDYTG